MVDIRHLITDKKLCLMSMRTCEANSAKSRSVFHWEGKIYNAHASNRIVIITAIVVAATASAVSSKFGAFSYVGGIIGSSVSTAFLLLLGAANAYIFVKLLVRMRNVLAMSRNPEAPAEGQGFRQNVFDLEDEGARGGGCLFMLFRRMFKLIDR